MRVENDSEVKILLTNVKELFNSLDDNQRELEKAINITEMKTIDYLHELEISKLNGIEMMKIAKELICIRKERRKLKDNLDLIKAIKGYANKFITKGIIAETEQAICNINTLKKNQANRQYTPKVIMDLKCAKKKGEE